MHPKAIYKTKITKNGIYVHKMLAYQKRIENVKFLYPFPSYKFFYSTAGTLFLCFFASAYFNPSRDSKGGVKEASALSDDCVKASRMPMRHA